MAFRILLVVIFSTIAVYTSVVISNHGLGLVSVFFGDIVKMGWPGQFNLDFLGFLTLSAVWTAWRNNFSNSGLVLGALALFFGAPFLTGYLLYLSFRCNQNMQQILLGEHRADI